MDSQISEFVAVQRQLLASELSTEDDVDVSKSNQKSMHKSNQKESESSTSSSSARVLSNLSLHQVSVGLYGRTVVTLGLEDDKLLPSHRFKTGDEVQIMSKSKTSKSQSGEGGVVSQVEELCVSVALFGTEQHSTEQQEEETTILGAPPFSVVPKSSVDVHNKLIRALQDLERHGTSHPLAGNIIQAAFSTDQTSQSCTTTMNTTTIPQQKIQPYAHAFNPLLDPSQQEAIAFSLTDNQYISLIHGPPGTGKTSTVAELIQQAVFQYKYKVLVAAPSNVAVDNVLERIVQSQHQRTKKQSPRIKAVRLGHPARIKPAILQYSLEHQVQCAQGTEIVKDVRKELQSFLQILLDPKSRDRRTAYREVKSLRKEVRQRETKVVQQLLQDAQVVLCTNVGAANRMLNDCKFDLVIIDEAAQALEASCWIPILRGKRLVLAGDHLQLPPTIKSNNPSVQKGLATTLFERILDNYHLKTEHVSRMLKVQYRMHKDIANWASTAMYRGDLETHESVAHHKLSELANYHGDDDQPALLLIDTAGCDMEESVNAAGSRFNEGEAQLVVKHVQTLLSRGVKAEEIAVISPYNGQVEILKALLLPEIAPKLEIRSVDGFQGGEREAVVLSLVRSNRKGVIGFLRDERRLNVAVTRARRHCAVICDSDTVSQNKFIGGLVDWMEEYGDYRSAMEFQSSDLQGDLEHAEVELLKLLSEPKPQTERVEPKKTTARERVEIAKREEAEIGSLLDKISKFAENGSLGEEMVLSKDLSRNERRLVHERGTELGIEHGSEGVDGVDRHIVLKIPGASTAVSTNGASEEANEDEEVDDEMQEKADDEEDDDSDDGPSNRPSTFAALEDDEDEDAREESGDDAVVPEAQPTMNQMLAGLALERRQRQHSATSSVRQQPSQPTAGSGGKKKKKKKGGQKLGGTANNPAQPKDDVPDDVDDMAFLDSQIDKVQNSHGRKVEGTGGFKTILNGILIAKPQPQTTKKDPRKSTALNDKLKKSQEDRKAKGGKKK